MLEISPVVDELGKLFRSNGFDLYLVGGSVRDALLGRVISDLDFTTDARPERIQQILRPWGDSLWDTGIDFGTVGVGKNGLLIEITTFRSDLYDGDSRNPVVTFGDTLSDDLQRRDFAINAMAISVPDHVFTDPFGGLKDLAAHRLDTPASPEQSFTEDPLRMLRAVRFAAQLDLVLAPRVRAAIVDMAPQLQRITTERVQAELVKLIMAPHPRAGLTLLVDAGLADIILPELPALKLEKDEHHQHKDVYQHSLTVLEQAIAQEKDGPDQTLRLAALLHDIGKPATRRFEPGGGVSFHHHEVKGAKLVRKRLQALKFPKQITEDVANLTLLHLRFHGFSAGEWTDSAVRRYVTDAGPLLPRLHKLVRADSTTRNQRRKAALRAAYDSLESRIAVIAAAEDLARVRPDLDGNAIMRLLGVPAGPVVGRAWAFLKELRLERGPLDPEVATAELLAWAEREGVTPQ
ncbi:MAG: CCA tRNA nucleotidyltransferase [Actinomycetota bacterium]|nr:CCA tRNA nucleotidyltransferase [Actinomycetota bacterium]